MKPRVAFMFGQFGAVADPQNFPRCRDRVAEFAETILVEHTDSQKVYDFLHGYAGPTALIGASLGAMSVVICAGYLSPQKIDFVGGFQPSDWDPSGHPIEIKEDNDVITRCAIVPHNVRFAVCFRNPIAAQTLALGHATYLPAQGNTYTHVEVIKREDIHPGDFDPAQSEMIEKLKAAIAAHPQ